MIWYSRLFWNLFINRGEEGYFRIAQTEKGPYGLFGLLVHGVVPKAAQNVTEQKIEDPSSSSVYPSSGGSSPSWCAWLYIVAAAVALVVHL
jgi:hypothetical protein